jgi:hypothetical protein
MADATIGQDAESPVEVSVVPIYAAPPAPGVTLTDAEREVLRRLGPSDHAHACYMVTISPEERRTVAGLLARAAKEMPE